MYSMDDNAEEIRRKFHQMGVLLLLDSPAQLEIGIDNVSWKVGQQFKGIKLIPLGTHIVTYSLKNENYMFPIKKFINFSSNKGNECERIHVYRWSQKADRFMSLRGEEAEGYREGVRKYHFDSYLGPYPLENIQFWAQNTKYINKEVLHKLEPAELDQSYQEYGKKSNPEQDMSLNIDEDEGDDEQVLEEMEQEIIDSQGEKAVGGKQKEGKGQENPGKFKDLSGNVSYSQIPRRLNCVPEFTSQINLDRSPILEEIVKKQWKGKGLNLLGELQYSFIAFLIGECGDSYNQWKHLMILMSEAETAFVAHKELMLEFIAVLYEQIKQFPPDFFHDQISKGNFLCSCLSRLKAYLNEGKVGKKAISRIRKLLEMVGAKFNYWPESEDEEECPVVVEEGEAYF